MKFKNLVTTALLATAAVLTGQTARATLPIYNTGEIFIGFRTADGANNYLINIGNVSQFASLGAGTSITLNTGGNIAFDLSSNTGFGADWFTAGDVLWGAFGATWDESAASDNVLFATRVRSNPAIQSAPWSSRSDTAQALSVADLKGTAQYYSNAGNPTANSTKGTFQPSGNANSWAHYTALGSDFRLGGSLEGGVGSVLDLYQIDPLAAPGQKGTLLGTLTIDNGGTITFATPVPEASTYGVFIAAGLGLLVLARRRKLLSTNS